MLGPAGRDVLSGDEGVNLRVLSMACAAGLGPRLGRQLALAIFDWIEAWYNPRRRHSYVGMLSPIDYEHQHAAINTIAA